MGYRLILGISLVLVLGACQSLSERKQADRLQEVLRNYEGVIRWGSVEQARNFQQPDKVTDEVIQPVGVTRVTHYEVIQGPSMVDDETAIQTALIQYVFVDTQIVREIVDQQTWKYDKENEAWYLTTPLPVLK
jgi:hypothetical protein